jgi:hypothetical protein
MLFKQVTIATFGVESEQLTKSRALVLVAIET